ncbi:MAG: polysaccharide deacetylase family protein, partial [Methylocystis sp.]
AKEDGVPLVKGSMANLSPHGLDNGGDPGASTDQIPDRHRVALDEAPDLWVPWWHTTFLIDMAFVRRTRAFYPDLSDGEDPVFIATLLAHTDRISIISDVVYLCRTSETPKRQTLQNVIDFARHAALVRAIYLEARPHFWRDGYRRFLTQPENCKWFWRRAEVLGEAEKAVVWSALRKAGLAPYMHESESANSSFEMNHADAISYWNAVFAAPDPWRYDSAYETRKRERIVSLVAPDVFDAALELACGEGHLTHLLAERVRRLEATDISSVAIERARERCAERENVSFRQSDLLRDPITGPYDLIVCTEVLYYVPNIADLDRTIERLAGALNPSGALLLAHSNHVVDDPDETGFDWSGHAFAARTISARVEASGYFEAEHEVRTSLYRIVRYRKRTADAPASLVGSVAYEPIDEELDPFVERGVIWNGAITTRLQAEETESTQHLPILMYHRIADNGPDELEPYRLSPDRFEAQMAWLRRHGYRSVSIEYWLESRRTRTPLPGRPILITFDDGYKDFYTTAWPILRRFDFSALVFLVSGHVGGVAEWDAGYGNPAPLMDWTEISELSREGVAFGGHTQRHPCLTDCSAIELNQELTSARLDLQARVASFANVLAYPFGAYNEEVVASAVQGGYAAGVTTEFRAASFDDEIFCLPRLEIPGRLELDEFSRLLRRQRCGPLIEAGRL